MLPARRWRGVGADGGGRVALGSRRPDPGAAIGVGTVAHVSAGGLLPRAWLLVALGVLATAGCAALLGRPASHRRIVLLVVSGQSLCHLVLTAVAGHTGTANHPASHATLQPPSPVPGLGSAPRTGSLHDLTVGHAATSGARHRRPGPALGGAHHAGPDRAQHADGDGTPRGRGPGRLVAE